MHVRLRMLLGVIARPQRARNLAWRFTVAYAAYTILMAGLPLAALWIVWQSWSSGGLLAMATNDLGGLFAPYIQLLVVGLKSAAAVRTHTEANATATALLRAAAARDATIAPVAIADAPEAADTRGFRVPTPSGTTITVALPEALMTSRLAIGVALVASAFVALPTIIIVVVAAPTMTNFLASPLADWVALALAATAIICAIFSVMLLTLGVRSLRRLQRQRRGFAVAVSADGLRFRRPHSPGRERYIAWSAAQSLARIAFTDAQTHQRTIFLLDAGQQTLLWEAPPIERYGAPAAKQQRAMLQADALRLAAQIAARSGLPLLDLSDAIAGLLGTETSATKLSPITDAYYAAINERDFAAAQAFWPALDRATHSSLRLQRWTPDARAASKREEVIRRRAALIDRIRPAAGRQRRELVRYALALLPYYPGQTYADQVSLEAQRALRRERRRQRISQFLTNVQRATLILSVAVGGLFWLSGFYLDSARQAMPVRVRHESPLYATSFRYPDGAWPAHIPNKTDTSSLGCVNGAYQISGRDPNFSVMGVTNAITMRDGAEQVTVSEAGKADENHLAWVGLVFDANADNSKFSTFMIDELGDWSLSHYDGALPSAQQWSTPDAGSSDAVHIGEGASNTLLLVRQRDLYLLYVNGRLVDSFTDQSHALTPGGWVGVYLDQGGFVARFTNFSVAAVPSLLPTWLPAWLPA